MLTVCAPAHTSQRVELTANQSEPQPSMRTIIISLFAARGGAYFYNKRKYFKTNTQLFQAEANLNYYYYLYYYIIIRPKHFLSIFLLNGPKDIQ